MMVTIWWVSTKKYPHMLLNCKVLWFMIAIERLTVRMSNTINKTVSNVFYFWLILAYLITILIIIIGPETTDIFSQKMTDQRAEEIHGQ